MEKTPDPRDYFRPTMLQRATPGVVRYIEALEDRLKELEAKLASVNRVIYAEGAPLGSPTYFEIREIVAPFGR